MSTAIIFAPPGGGKTVNATLVPGKKLLLSTDNSAIVLRNFKRDNLTIKGVATFGEWLAEFDSATQSKQYDVIITDCLTDLIDGYVVECRESKALGDIRQAYMTAYNTVKSRVRKAAYCDTDCIFTCWEDADEYTAPTGEVKTRLSPMLPANIKQQVCGLCNVIAYVTAITDKNGDKRWVYITEPRDTMMVKDQLGCRKVCKPEDIFNVGS